MEQTFEFEDIGGKECKRRLRIIGRWIYLRLPIFLRKKLRPWVEKNFVMKFEN